MKTNDQVIQKTIMITNENVNFSKQTLKQIEQKVKNESPNQHYFSSKNKP